MYLLSWFFNLVVQNDMIDIPDREVSESKHSYLKSNASKMVNKSV